MSNYVVYHLHTDDSLLDGASKYTDYIELARQNGMTALAFSEHGIPRCWVKKKLACDKAGIKYIHAVEIYLTEQLEPKVRDNYHTVLIARNAKGVRELNRLIKTSSDESHFYYTNRLSFDEFLSLSDNIITTSACLASPLNKLPADHPRYMELARKYDYLEIQAHNCDDQVRFNQRLYELSKTLGKPLIAGTDTHVANKYKAECRGILMKRKGKSYGDEDRFDLTWKSYDELVGMFEKQGALPAEVYLKAIENTNIMADSVDSFDLDTSIKYPILHGSREKDDEEFTKLVERKFAEKVQNGIIPPEQVSAFKTAIADEMAVFRKLEMTGFMLSMSELICWCKESGMAIGTARGSVGGSRVAYVTDIIDLNPEQWHTVFSRFANENRVEIGDIDIDVVESDRPAIFRHIIQRFGEDQTARVASFGTIAELAAIDDIGGALRIMWEEANSDSKSGENPWSVPKIAEIKRAFQNDPEATQKQYPKLFYYYDGLLGLKVSQSVHPAGMIIAPVNLAEEYGVFYKDGELCLLLDMDECHEVGLAKYDFLILKTVAVLRDTCRYLGEQYPKTNAIDWNDQEVWTDMLRSPGAIFQMEGSYAFQSLKQYQPHSIFDMSLVTACIRPSGASYRDELLSHKQHHNPSELIDDLLKDNNGFLVYQEDIIAFLQKVCGLSGSEADTVRRGIAKKKIEILEQSLPKIMDGYCSRSDHPREVAERECREFLQIIEDASAYMFGYNHSIAYCLLGYLCAYYRYYHPVEFITAFLNNAANDDDIQNGTILAKQYDIQITSPRFSISKREYSCNAEKRIIAKGLSSIKYIGDKLSDVLFELGRNHYDTFTDLLVDLANVAHIDARQLDILTHIDFFSDFGNQRELDNVIFLWDFLKQGDAKQVKRAAIAGSYIEEIVRRYSDGKTKDGKEAANYKIEGHALDIIRDCERHIKTMNLPDVGVITKVKRFTEAMGYSGYVSGREEDRPKLYIKDIFPVKRKSDGKQFGYNILTQSIGSGIESRFTLFNRVYNQEPVEKGDVIVCLRYERDGQYFTMTKYRKIYTDDDDTYEGELE